MPSILQKNWLLKKKLFDAISEVSNYAKGLLLDIGCGEKPYFMVFSSLIEDYVGIDLNILDRGEEMLLRKKVIDIYGSALNLPFKNNSFDTILSIEVLEHIPEPNVAISEISRIVKRNGYLILSAPQIWHLHEEPYDYFRFTKYGLKYLLEKHNFEVKYLRSLGGFFLRIGIKINYSIDYFAKNWLIKILMAPIIVIIQLIFDLLNDVFPTPKDSINNLVVAKKE